MRSTFFFIILFFLVNISFGQRAHFVHEFEDHKVYQSIGHAQDISWVTTVKVKDSECLQLYMSIVDIEDEKIKFKGGSEWEVERSEKGLNITFPDTTVTYKRTDIDPMGDVCVNGTEESI